MKITDKINAGAGYILLGLLALLGLCGIVVFIPTWVGDLTTEFLEFSSDATVLQTLLTAPVIAFELVTLEVAYLLWLVHRDRMFSTTVFKWVRLLWLTSLGMAVSFMSIGAWLAGKNTLPPAILFVIAALSFFALAVSSITNSLLALLAKATNAKQDLEGVI
ncbi:MAG: hypothetical protein RL672_1069 [Actinomycetota bacterium]|jgi:hypothetical protein